MTCFKHFVFDMDRLLRQGILHYLDLNLSGFFTAIYTLRLVNCERSKPSKYMQLAKSCFAQFIVNPLLLVFSLTSTALLLLLTNALWFLAYFTESLIFVPNYENFHVQLFNLNGFPSHMFGQHVRCFHNNIFEPKPVVHTAPKKTVYFSLPFTGSHFLQICNSVAHLNIRFVFRSSTRISSFFIFKDKVPKFLKSGVVYLFKCRCCSASYVGQITRHLHTRVSDQIYNN